MNKYTIIVAGGSGKRMGSAVPKQFLELAGKPVLMHTIQKFAGFDAAMEIILVLPAAHITLWNDLCEKYNFNQKHKLVMGGDVRFQSVKNGLNALPDDGIVAIHDGVRPLVSDDTISRCFTTAEKYGNAIPAMQVTETVRQISGEQSVHVNRENLRLIQTPQVFRIHLIKKAYEQPCIPEFTDDANVLEKLGEQIRLVEGNRENIKITEPVDLVLAEALMK
jgi:2-C-methyl-D-erythritol 4-phosphate cytidylyltransferase